MSIPRDVIVIGAAEGGLEPLAELVQALPADFPAAVLVMLRSDSHALALLGEVVARRAALPIAYAREGGDIRPGEILLAVLGTQLVVRAPGVVGPEESFNRESRPSIDAFFRSAADIYGHRVIGVILSGCDGDGTAGVKAIEEADGIGIVQDPEDAAVPEMPNHVLEHDSPHYIAPISGIATLLTTLVGVGRNETAAGNSGRRDDPKRM